MNSFFQTKLFKIMFFLTASLFGMITYEITTNKPIFIETAITTIAKPCSCAIISVHKKILGTFEKFFDSGRFQEENELLKHEIAKTRKKMATYNNLKNENEQLKQALRIKENNQNFEVEIAKFAAKNPNDFYGFTINIGKNKGLSKGDVVLTKNGIVGSVSKVQATYSFISTILDLDIQIPVIDSEKDEKGVVCGDTEFSKQGLCVMRHLNRTTNCKVGDTITTYGHSNYPENLPVGTIKEIKTDKNGMSCIAIIKPFESVFCVKDLIIIKRSK